MYLLGELFIVIILVLFIFGFGYLIDGYKKLNEWKKRIFIFVIMFVVVNLFKELKKNY